MTEQSVQLVVGFFAVLAALGLAAALLRPVYLPVWKAFGRTQHFLDDWFGEAARQGVAARPGAMERLAQLESNSGSTMRDKVSLIAEQMVATQRAAEEASRLAAEAVRHAEQSAEEQRLRMKQMQHDVTNVRQAQASLLDLQVMTDRRISDHKERNVQQILGLRKAVDALDVKSASRDRALGEALSEALDVTVAVAEAAEQKPPTSGGG